MRFSLRGRAAEARLPRRGGGGRYLRLSDFWTATQNGAASICMQQEPCWNKARCSSSPLASAKLNSNLLNGCVQVFISYSRRRICRWLLKISVLHLCDLGLVKRGVEGRRRRFATCSPLTLETLKSPRLALCRSSWPTERNKMFRPCIRSATSHQSPSLLLLFQPLADSWQRLGCAPPLVSQSEMKRKDSCYMGAWRRRRVSV